MAKTWKNLEDNVRDLAAAIWQSECRPAHVGGVDLDGVIAAADDIKIFIEITERQDLAKVREDIIKLRTAKDALLQETGSYARCYCVVDGNITTSMIEAGEPYKIQVVYV